MTPLNIKAPAYAARLGINPRSLLRFIHDEKMPGASKPNGIWRIDPAKAEPWLRERHPRLFKAEALALPTKSDNGKKGPAGDSELEITDRHIQRLNHILDGLVTVLHDGTYNRNLVQSITQISAELRLLEKHRLEMLTANAELMTRHEHHRVIATLARLIATEIDGLGHSIPEDFLDALTTAGCTISKPKAALKAVTRAAHEQAKQLRHRIADAIEKSTIGDP